MCYIHTRNIKGLIAQRSVSLAILRSRSTTSALSGGGRSFCLISVIGMVCVRSGDVNTRRCSVRSASLCGSIAINRCF